METIRNKLYVNLYDFQKVAPGKYTVKRGGEVYRIEGGKDSGGTSREWFLDEPVGHGNSTIRCSSIRDALDLIENL